MRLLTMFLLVKSFIGLRAQTIQDPIQDYLQMSVPDRQEYLDAYTTVYKATVDVDGDGKSEVFVSPARSQTLFGNAFCLWNSVPPLFITQGWFHRRSRKLSFAAGVCVPKQSLGTSGAFVQGVSGWVQPGSGFT